MKIHHLQPDQALRSLHTQSDGLSETEALRRLREYGANRLTEFERQSVVFALRPAIHSFLRPAPLACRSPHLFRNWKAPGEGMDTLGFAIGGVILINGLFSFWQEHRAERTIAALQKLLPLQVKVMREGKVRLVDASDIVPGDVILLQEGDDVPADCRVLQAFALRVNNATVTGEALPKARDAQPSAVDELIHARNVLLAGTAVVSGECRAVVFHTGMHTEFGKIAHLTQEAGEAVSPLQKEILRLSRLVGALAVSLGIAFFSSAGRQVCRSGRTLSSPSASSSPTCRRACCPRSPFPSPWLPNAWPNAMPWSGICLRLKPWVLPPSSVPTKPAR